MFAKIQGRFASIKRCGRGRVNLITERTIFVRILHTNELRKFNIGKARTGSVDNTQTKFNVNKYWDLRKINIGKARTKSVDKI